MSHYLGIDIGTFESKGVLVDHAGAIVASASRPHKMIVPQPGWAKFLFKLLLAVGVMAAALWFTAGEPALWMAASAPVRALRLTGLVLLGAAIYFAALWLMGFRMRDFSRRESQ